MENVRVFFSLPQMVLVTLARDLTRPISPPKGSVLGRETLLFQ